MKYLSRFKKITFSISLIILNWILFVLFTHNHNNILYFVPLLILFFQIFILLKYKTEIIRLCVLLNPVVFCLIFYSIKPSINYINYIKKTPTIIKCTSHRASEPTFDKEEQVFLDYFVDDCDWNGLYHYTLEVNNYTSYKLIQLFGNSYSNKPIETLE